MKATHILLAASMATTANAACSFCPDGITAGRDDVEIGRGVTCEDLAAAVAAVAVAEERDVGDECVVLGIDILSAEPLCCPPARPKKCAVCPDGISLAEDWTSLLDDDVTTEKDILPWCESAIDLYASFEDDSQECIGAKAGYHAMCCPIPLKNPCTICPDGIEVDEAILFFGGDVNETQVAAQVAETVAGCEEAKAAFVIYEEDSEFCPKQDYERMCCPSPPSDPCSLCPDGINIMDGLLASMLNETELAEFVASCQMSIDYHKTLEADSESCREALAFGKMSCCPVPVEEPCSLCPDGITVEDGLLGSMMSETELAEVVTGCQMSIDYHKTLEADSESCREALEYGKMSCCPTAAEDPCTICAGAAVNAELTIPGVGDCQAIIDQAVFLPAESEECIGMGGFEVLCCPTLAATPCQVCPEGYEIDAEADAFVDDDDVPEFDLICGEVIKYLEEGSELCKLASEDLNSTCCVPVAEVAEASSPEDSEPRPDSDNVAAKVSIPATGDDESTSPGPTSPPSAAPLAPSSKPTSPPSAAPSSKPTPPSSPPSSKPTSTPSNVSDPVEQQSLSAATTAMMVFNLVSMSPLLLATSFLLLA